LDKTTGLSLIISFYNRIDFLVNIISSLKIQSFTDFEVIISDDGSSSDAVSKAKDILDKSGLNYQYVYHEHTGFRKTTILNKSVVASRSDYLVFIDGDCVLHKQFLKEHFNGKEHGVVRSGRRVNLTEKTSKKLNEQNMHSGYLGFRILFDLVLENTQNGMKAFEQGIYFKSRFLRKFLSSSDKGLLGCNFSIHKQDLLLVNGFDERFNKAGVGEDTDLHARLLRAGIKVKSITKRAIVYHQYHELLKREDDIYKFYEENKNSNVSYTPYGIVKERKSE
jgi:glycosyltransferase involved in cell wall biosynthesis